MIFDRKRMSHYYLLLRLFLVGLLATSLPVMAQTSSQVLKITYPESRAVFQRETDNTSTIYLSGSLYQPVDSVQARVQAEGVGQGFNTDWATIQRKPQGGFFRVHCAQKVDGIGSKYKSLLAE